MLGKRGTRLASGAPDALVRGRALIRHRAAGRADEGVRPSKNRYACVSRSYSHDTFRQTSDTRPSPQAYHTSRSDGVVQVTLPRAPSQPTSAFYLCSKSTGAVTSCTRKYLASAGYFLATASYIA